MPMTPKVVGMTPATTMRGALAASTESSRPAVPRRPARRARSSPLYVRISAGFEAVVDLAVGMAASFRGAVVAGGGRGWRGGGGGAAPGG
ncbi:hypothetical protein GCM10020254_65250 [Streptomyces goshikiensis]